VDVAGLRCPDVHHPLVVETGVLNSNHRFFTSDCTWRSMRLPASMSCS
jgi:hypothetical protein